MPNPSDLGTPEISRTRNKREVYVIKQKKRRKKPPQKQICTGYPAHITSRTRDTESSSMPGKQRSAPYSPESSPSRLLSFPCQRQRRQACASPHVSTTIHKARTAARWGMPNRIWRRARHPTVESQRRTARKLAIASRRFQRAHSLHEGKNEFRTCAIRTMTTKVTPIQEP